MLSIFRLTMPKFITYNYLSSYIVEKIMLNGKNPKKLKVGNFLDRFSISWPDQEEWFEEKGHGSK